MKVFAVTASLICLVVANALPTEEGMSMKNNVDVEDPEEKVQFFAKLCRLQCTKLRCAGSQPLPNGGECTCTSCDMGPIGETIARTSGAHLKHGHPKPTFNHVQMELGLMITNGSTANATITINYISSKGKGIAALQDKEMINKICAIECSRLDCDISTFDMDKGKCVCNSCNLEDGGAEENRKKRLFLPGTDASSTCNTTVTVRVCVRLWWWRRLCYYKIRNEATNPTSNPTDRPWITEDIVFSYASECSG